ncbi:DUF4913 domain-containing protein [Parafrankia sp. FMc6]|uniref:DUF4913 domain-containing protein n=1 Tax=Parafrankia soli TaxID=2599596 RepID=UPI0034D73C2F
MDAPGSAVTIKSSGGNRRLARGRGPAQGEGVAAAADGTGPDADDAGEGDDPPQLCYLNLELFVEEFLAVMFPRPLVGEFRWCPWRWDHSEAVRHLESLWRAFESLRLDGELGIAIWLRDHFDHQRPSCSPPPGRSPAARRTGPAAPTNPTWSCAPSRLRTAGRTSRTDRRSAAARPGIYVFIVLLVSSMREL